MNQNRENPIIFIAQAFTCLCTLWWVTWKLLLLSCHPLQRWCLLLEMYRAQAVSDLAANKAVGRVIDLSVSKLKSRATRWHDSHSYDGGMWGGKNLQGNRAECNLCMAGEEPSRCTLGFIDYKARSDHCDHLVWPVQPKGEWDMPYAPKTGHTALYKTI